MCRTSQLISAINTILQLVRDYYHHRIVVDDQIEKYFHEFDVLFDVMYGSVSNKGMYIEKLSLNYNPNPNLDSYP